MTAYWENFLFSKIEEHFMKLTNSNHAKNLIR